MAYLYVLLCALLMLADYYLTLWGSVLSKSSGHAQIFVNEHYELNPQWQTDVTRLRWVNPQFLVRAAIVLIALIILAAVSQLDPLFRPIFEFFVGLFLGMYAVLDGRHLYNILVFRYMAKHPDYVVGQVKLDYLLSLQISQYQLVTILLPLLVVVIAAPSFLGVGALLGLLRLEISFINWSRKARTHKSSQFGPKEEKIGT